MFLAIIFSSYFGVLNTGYPAPYLLHSNEQLENYYPNIVPIPSYSKENSGRKIEIDYLRNLLFFNSADYLMLVRTKDLSGFSIELQNISCLSFSLIFGTENLVLLGKNSKNKTIYQIFDWRKRKSIGDVYEVNGTYSHIVTIKETDFFLLCKPLKIEII